jgi:hypothetical protein
MEQAEEGELLTARDTGLAGGNHGSSVSLESQDVSNQEQLGELAAKVEVGLEVRSEADNLNVGALDDHAAEERSTVVAAGVDKILVVRMSERDKGVAAVVLDRVIHGDEMFLGP